MQKTIPLALALLLYSCPLFAQTFDERMSDWPMDLKTGGAVIVNVGDQATDDCAELFVRFAGGDDAKIVSIRLVQNGEEPLEELFNERFADVKSHAHFQLSRGTGQTDSTDDVDDGLNNQLAKASGIWLKAEGRLNRHQKKVIMQLRTRLSQLIADKGVVYANEPVARLLGKYEIIGGQMFGDQQQATINSGLNLIPDVVVSTKVKGDSNSNSRLRLLSVLASHPRSIGVELENHTAIVLSGRRIRTLGEGSATFITMANERLPFRIKTIKRAESRRANPEEFMVDLTGWRRDAIDRTLEVFPPEIPQTPHVANGTLLIVGGGGLPEGLMDTFIELAGGDDAKLVYVPCSEREETSPRDMRLVNAWREKGLVANLTHTKDRNQANTDEEFLEPLKDATGIFFGGGRQWNFSDSYYGTKAHKLMKDVLARGGVIAGSSAGASIQARYLARATPINNVDIMAPGYERGGLGFISGVAIDQHFSQRGRQKDMTQLVNRYPQMLGIGIDETTAIIVQKSNAEVVGKGQVFFYDRKKQKPWDDPDYVALAAGGVYDLAKRKVTKQPAEGKEKPDTEKPDSEGGPTSKSSNRDRDLTGEIDSRRIDSRQ